jgi:hypothetical protein
MERVTALNLNESAPNIITIRPPSESLLNISVDNSLWPEEIKNNQEIKRQAQIRISLSNLLDLDPSPELYKSLTNFLESDSHNSRLILYLPFELIPSKENEFAEVYLRHWHKMLTINDVRANFMDGDVLEMELRDKPLERVTKAAHLLPKLVEKNLLSITDVINLIENNRGSTLGKSMVDTLPVLVDMDLLSEEKMEDILKSNGLELTPKKAEALPEEKVTEARAKWLEEKDEPVEIEKYSDQQLNIPFAVREKFLKNDLDELKVLVKSIESDPELSEYLYPTIILFGSKIKGYGAITADMDIAILVKPSSSPENRSKLKRLIAQKFSHENIKGKVVEFWLEEDHGELNVTDFLNPDSGLADSGWAHVLFEGAWIGDETIIKELHQKLLPGFLYSKDKTIDGADARGIWLEEMERDTLQYRLMHKGYARLFPTLGINTKHADQIDGQSAFYDSGYRKLATKLFVTKVFLPQIEKPQK